MATPAKIDALEIGVDSEGDPKSVTIFVTTLEVVPQYLTASGNFDTPLDVPGAIDSLGTELNVEL